MHQYKCSFLQSSFVLKKVTSLLSYIIPWWWLKVGQKPIPAEYHKIDPIPAEYHKINPKIWKDQ